MSDKTTHYGIGITDLLLVVFIVLKLTGVINWSWWWVFSPLWITLGIAIIILIGFGIYWLVKKYL